MVRGGVRRVRGEFRRVVESVQPDTMGLGRIEPMAIAEILAEIDSEIGRLQEVRRLLSSTSRFAAAGGIASRKKRTLSPEARQRIVDAQRKRWAAQRAKKK
jgi:hypothetical protein